jgi:hypothetical protein
MLLSCASVVKCGDDSAAGRSSRMTRKHPRNAFGAVRFGAACGILVALAGAGTFAANGTGTASDGGVAAAAGGLDFQAAAAQLTEAMTRDLALSPSQIPEVERVNTTAGRALQEAARGIGSTDKSARQESMRGMIQAFATRENDLKGVLTPGQWQQFLERRQERTADLQTKLWTVTLGLDETQQQKVRSLNLHTAQRMQAALAPAREPLASRPEKMRALRAARTVQSDRDDALQRILTKDQWKTYQEQKEQAQQMMQEALRNR